MPQLTSGFEGNKRSLFDSPADRTNRRIDILFRHAVPEIPVTTYGTFAIFKYPAKFIPQVIAYVLKEYAKPGMKVFDPFGGHGTTGLVSRIYSHDYELWDLNPLLKVIHDTAIIKVLKIDPSGLIEEIKKSRVEFLPEWENLNYWFPDDFLLVLSRAWGFAHSLPDETKQLLLIPLLKTTRYFSFSDDRVHKLYRSRLSKEKVKHLLEKNWKDIFYGMLKKEILTLTKKIHEYNHLKPESVDYKVKAGVDVLNTELDNEVDILITSPPYLQAQEYIRSTKLELFWLGYTENCIKELSKKEIPYNKVDEIKIYSDKYYYFRERIKEKHLLRLYDRYFHSILRTFSRLGEKVKNYMCIFVGPAKIRTTSIPIDDIIIDHLKEFGWEHEITYVDQIVSRVTFEFKTRVNPASGLEDNRIKTEHLVVLKKK